MNYDELLDVSVTLGYDLIENGAEVYRVEESITRILQAYAIENCEVFAIPSCIITTIITGDEQPHTRMKRVKAKGTNLHKVSLLNDLSRKICKNKPDYYDIKKQLDEIQQTKVYSPLMQIFAASLISFSFCLFFGGGILDALVAVICGAVLKIVLNSMEKFNTNPFFRNVVGSITVTCIAFVFVRLNVCNLMNKIIIGTLMNLVPGVALTNSMRDIIAGDLLAGIINIAQAVMIAIAIALGTGIAVYGLNFIR